MNAGNEIVVREWFEQVWNRKEPGAIARYLTEATIAHGMGDAPLVGIAAFEEAYNAFCQVFPDIQITIEQLISDGDKTVAYLRCEATHQGSLMGIAPTGKKVSFHATAISRIVDGKVVEGWNLIDVFTVLQQIGALPANG